MPENTPLLHRPTALYRFYDADGRLLYVGITFALKQRWRMHRQEKEWWPLVAANQVEWLPDRWQAMTAETAAIKAEKPLFNIQDSLLPVAPLPEIPAPASRTEEAVAALRKAARAKKTAEDRADAARAALAVAMTNAVHAGVKQSEVVSITGLTREHVRRLVRDVEEKRALAASDS